MGNRRYIHTKLHKGRIWFLFFVFVVACGCLLVGFGAFALRDSVTKIAKSRAKEIAILTVNEAISQKLSQEKFSYSDFARFTYSADGAVTSVENNLTKISAHNADLALQVGKAIQGISKEKLTIPLGTLSGIDILYGVGPDVPIEIKPYGYADAELTTDFYTSGINQTVFEVKAEVSANISVLMPTIRAGEKIETSVPVFSTVIVGGVPDSYTNVERHGFEYEDDVLELLE